MMFSICGIGEDGVFEGIVHRFGDFTQTWGGWMIVDQRLFEIGLGPGFFEIQKQKRKRKVIRNLRFKKIFAF